jgi:hypothetical protein
MKSRLLGVNSGVRRLGAVGFEVYRSTYDQPVGCWRFSALSNAITRRSNTRMSLSREPLNKLVFEFSMGLSVDFEDMSVQPSD